MDNDQVISTINDLIETSKDGEEGFRTCAQDMEDQQVASMLKDRAQDCERAASELQGLVRSWGGEPADSGSVSGRLHRHWIDAKSAILGKDLETILNECERGEDVAVSSYRDALKKELPPSVRSVVERQYQGVLQNHDRIKNLRNQVRAKRQ